MKKVQIKPDVMVGKPVIRDTRIPVSLILNLLRNGYNFDRIIEAYPALEKEDIQAALDYTESKMTREEVVIPQISFQSA